MNPRGNYRQRATALLAISLLFTLVTAVSNPEAALAVGEIVSFNSASSAVFEGDDPGLKLILNDSSPQRPPRSKSALRSPGARRRPTTTPSPPPRL